MAKSKKKKKEIATITHAEDKRKNIPTAELESVVSDENKSPVKLRYPRNTDLDPQLVWRGKDEQDSSELVVNAPPLYIQEKVHPKVLIDDLLKRSKGVEEKEEGFQPDLFGDFNGLPDEARSTEFYQHDANWTNRMILGDSLQVMASLAEREGLRGKVQCIYIDPPYGIKFNSNFQWSTTSRDVKDGKADHITREPEQVKAFRDTWRDGVHSYLTYLRDRLTVARDLLSESGSIFVQIGDENVHRVRALMEEMFGEDNFCSQILFVKTSSSSSKTLSTTFDFIVWFAKNADQVKYNELYLDKSQETTDTRYKYVTNEIGKVVSLSADQRKGISPISGNQIPFWASDPTSQDASTTRTVNYPFRSQIFHPGKNRHWSVSNEGFDICDRADRLSIWGKKLSFKRYVSDHPVVKLTQSWDDTTVFRSTDGVRYVVQTNPKVIQRCILMTTSPGDLVFDPTCGSGTTAFAAEQWGRRWITADTSRVALALARARIMGAKYPFYILADSRDGLIKEAEVTRQTPNDHSTHHNIRHGFVYQRVPHIMLSSIANNTEIDVIWKQFQEKLEPLRKDLNEAINQEWEEWEIPLDSDKNWSAKANQLHTDWWKLRIERQKNIDASIAAKADFEFLYDRPYEDNSKVRVAGPFTVESLSPHRVLGVDENDELIDHDSNSKCQPSGETDFAEMVLENLKSAGVQQSAKEDKIKFTSIEGWPGEYISAKATYVEGESENAPERTAGVFIGPEFGTVPRQDLVAAARECGDLGLSVLIGCAFNYDAHATDFDKLGNVRVLKARMNADLHMSDDLKKTDKGNLFVIFGEPDIEILEVPDGKYKNEKDRIQVKIRGVDIFHPNTGEIKSHGTDGIACWFIDTDYNEESFFVRHAYFLGAGDPYKSLKTTLKAEINREAWDTLYSDISRPFPKPESGRIAVKVINHLGDEVMKVFKI